jgi:hypothetical protein
MLSFGTRKIDTEMLTSQFPRINTAGTLHHKGHLFRKEIAETALLPYRTLCVASPPPLPPAQPVLFY